MTPHPTPTEPTIEENHQFHRGLLRELLEMGIGLARTVHAKAIHQAEAETQAETAALPPPARPAPTPDPILQFERISRAIRRTIALARVLDAPPPQPRPAPRPAPAAPSPRKTAPRTRSDRDSLEHLDDSELDELSPPSRQELIARIRRDLQLAALPIAPRARASRILRDRQRLATPTPIPRSSRRPEPARTVAPASRRQHPGAG